MTVKSHFRKACLLILLAATLFLHSRSQTDTAWISANLFPGANISSATTLSIDQGGNIFVAGSIYNLEAPYEDLFVVKYAPDGEIIWLQTFESQDTLSMSINTLCLDAESNAYVAFMRHHAASSYWSIAVQRYHVSDGSLNWTTEIANASFNGFEAQVKPKFMTIDGNDLYIVGTKFEPGVPGSSMLIVKIDLEGNLLWSHTHAGSGLYSNAKSVDVDIAGNVYITGDAWNESIDYCIVKYDPEGNLVWDAFYDGIIYNDTDVAQKVKVDDQGNVYITGYNQVSENTKDIVTVKYNNEGGFEWAENYGNPEYRHSNAYFIDFDESGNVYVGGYSAYENPYPGTGKDYILLKYNPEGNLLWEARFDHFNYIDDHPYDFTLGPEGNIYIGGISIKSCYPDEFITTVKYTPQGELAWTFCVPGIYGTPWEIAVTENDGFVVAGAVIDSNYSNQTFVQKCVPSGILPYENDITDVFFESQVKPPIINFDNHTIIATVHDTANLLYLVPFIETSAYACMYPQDEDTTSFAEPVWYNVTSFNNDEQWWYVMVQGGYVGLSEEKEGYDEVFPNPASDEITIRFKTTTHESPQIKIYDMHGKLWINKKMEMYTPKLGTICVSELPQGFYQLIIKTATRTSSLTFIKW